MGLNSGAVTQPCGKVLGDRFVEESGSLTGKGTQWIPVGMNQFMNQPDWVCKGGCISKDGAGQDKAPITA